MDNQTIILNRRLAEISKEIRAIKQDHNVSDHEMMYQMLGLALECYRPENLSTADQKFNFVKQAMCVGNASPIKGNSQDQLHHRLNPKTQELIAQLEQVTADFYVENNVKNPMPLAVAYSHIMFESFFNLAPKMMEQDAVRAGFLAIMGFFADAVTANHDTKSGK